MHAIGNAVGKYIDQSEVKDSMQAYAHICVEVYLGKALPKSIKLKVDDWMHIQQLEYEQIPFKSKVCHEYGHFDNRCTKLPNVENNPQEEQWETVKKKKIAPNPKPSHEAGPSSRPPPISPPSSSLPSFPPPSSPQPPLSSDCQLDPLTSSPSSNPFHILSLPEESPPLIQFDPTSSPLP